MTYGVYTRHLHDWSYTADVHLAKCETLAARPTAFEQRRQRGFDPAPNGLTYWEPERRPVHSGWSMPPVQMPTANHVRTGPSLGTWVGYVIQAANLISAVSGGPSLPLPDFNLPLDTDHYR